MAKETNHSPPQPSVETKERPRPLRLGIIGAGGRGYVGMLAHQTEQGAEITAPCDTHAEALRRTGADLLSKDCLRVSDYRELLKKDDLDAVFVCTPDYLHAEHGTAVLESGKALYLEKPMAITVADCDALLATAATCCQPFYIGHNMRFFR